MSQPDRMKVHRHRRSTSLKSDAPTENHLSHCHLLLNMVMEDHCEPVKQKRTAEIKPKYQHIWSRQHFCSISFISRFGWLFVLCPIQDFAHHLLLSSLSFSDPYKRKRQIKAIFTSAFYTEYGVVLFYRLLLLVRFTCFGCWMSSLSDGIAPCAYPHFRHRTK